MSSRRAEWWLLGVLCLLPAAAQAGQPRTEGAGEGAPSLELLEFLGAWETPEGKWVDPISLLREGDDEEPAPAAPAPRPAGKTDPNAKVKRDD